MSEENNKEGLSPQEEQKKHAEDKHPAHKKDKKKADRKDEELALAKEKIDELNDKYLRLYSEFDNFRKRTMKEKGELVKTASEEVIVSLLPVMDDLERAIAALETASKEGEASYLEGIKLIYNKFKNTLQQKGLEPVDSLKRPFDVDYHEAIAKIPAPEEVLKGCVVDEVLKGYLLNGKVIRFARVVVGE